MMSMRKRAPALLLALAMILAVAAGCGKKEPQETNQPSATPEYVYKAEYTSLGTEARDMSNYVYANGKLIYTANVVTGKETQTDPVSGESWEYETYATKLFSMNIDGSEIKELVDYKEPEKPEGLEGQFYINQILADAEGNIWVSENGQFYHFEYPEGYEPGGTGDFQIKNDWEYYVDDGSVVQLRKLSDTGAELAVVDLDAVKGENMYFYLNSVQIDSAGNVYLGVEANVYVLDKDGNILFNLNEPSGWINGLYRLKSGEVVAHLYEQTGDSGGYVLKTLDLAKKDWGEKFTAPLNAWDLRNGAGEYDLYYNSNISFFGFNVETGESVELLNWIDSDVDNNNLGAIVPLPDGRIFCASYNYQSENGGLELIMLTKVPSSELPQKTVLTYACMWLDYNLRSQILKFNRGSDTYRITVKDYSQYNTEDDYNAGLTKLSTEIIAGKVPDILSVSNLPFSRFAAKGLFEDLWPFIDADSEIKREDLVQAVFKASEIEGKLYQVSPRFQVVTALGATSVVGDKMGWTIKDLMAALQQLPPGADVFSMETTRETIMYMSGAMGMDSFVDWKTGKCGFDSPEFMSLLEFANLFPETFDYENFDWETDYEDEFSRIASGKQLLSMFYMSDFQNYQYYRQAFGGDVTFVGFPTESGNGSAFMLDGGLTMSSKCADKEGAWQFIRTVLTQGYQDENVWWNMPTNQKSFDKKLKEAMTPQYYTDENGNQVEQSRGGWSMGRDGETIEIYALTQAEADEIMELIGATTRLFTFDDSILTIVKEEAAPYFSGQKSVQEVAKIIQSRASIYVNEQR